MLTPYPDTLSFEAVKAVAGFFRGQTELPTAVHGAWDLLGFAAGTGLPDPAPFMGELPKGEEAAKAIESLLPGAGRAFPWVTIVAILLKLISDYFD